MKMVRVLSSVHAISTICSMCWTSLCAACLYIITRPDSQFLCTRVYILWFSVAWGSATFWWQSNACNCSMFCTCTQSGSPHNVMHFLVILKQHCLKLNIMSGNMICGKNFWSISIPTTLIHTIHSIFVCSCPDCYISTRFHVSLSACVPSCECICTCIM